MMNCSLNKQDAAGEEPARDVAIAIKRCLESLVKDARRSQMGDLAEFLALAVLAADDAARAAAGNPAVPVGSATRAPAVDLAHRKVAGTC
ncbi:hypothetical protein [Niveispirillum lacus]|uniref:hypothetical protein n=1 Tax=Niveispirillum lacus TaxID=1981099 RepID=UPI001FE78954|nr:hypothetical protein [Niveispirillum lacus]